jgi:hypothetical protein
MAGSDSAQTPTRSSPAIRVLLLTANPSEAARLAIGEEHRRIDRALRDSDGRDEVDLLRSLVPAALASPVHADAVLSRLLLATSPSDGATLDALSAGSERFVRAV